MSEGGGTDVLYLCEHYILTAVHVTDTTELPSPHCPPKSVRYYWRPAAYARRWWGAIRLKDPTARVPELVARIVSDAAQIALTVEHHLDAAAPCKCDPDFAMVLDIDAKTVTHHMEHERDCPIPQGPDEGERFATYIGGGAPGKPRRRS